MSTTIFGRICHFPAVASKNPSERAFVERQAINAPIQGSAADIIRRAMIRMEDALAAAKLDARMLLQVHDELVFEVPDDEVEATMPLIRKVMVDAPHPARAAARAAAGRCARRRELGRGALTLRKAQAEPASARRISSRPGGFTLGTKRLRRR